MQQPQRLGDARQFPNNRQKKDNREWSGRDRGRTRGKGMNKGKARERPGVTAEVEMKDKGETKIWNDLDTFDELEKLRERGREEMPAPAPEITGKKR